MKILIVEDDPILQKVFTRIIQREKPATEVICTPDAESALTMITSGLQVILVITDINLQGKMSGDELGKILRREKRIPYPIIYMSGSPLYCQSQSVQEDIQNGVATGFIEKGANLRKELCEILRLLPA